MKTTLLASVLGLLVACGGGGGNRSPDGDDQIDTASTDDPADYCRAYARSFCSTTYDCLDPSERGAEGLPATQEACERDMNASCRNRVDNCDANEDQAYSPTAAATCLAQMSEATCVDVGQESLGAAACDDLCALTHGSMSVSWMFSPSSQSCGSTGVAIVRVALDGPTRVVQDFDCYDGMAYFTDPLPAGEYTVRLALFDSGGVALWQSQPKTVVLDESFVTVAITIPVSSS